MTTRPPTDITQVEKLSKLAHIALDDSEKERIAEKLSSVFEWIGQMDQLTLEDTLPENSQCPLRCDGPVHNEPSADVLSNAPLKDNNFFVVPLVLE